MTSCRSLLDDSSSIGGVWTVNNSFELTIASLHIFVNFGLLYWIYTQRKSAYKGDSHALKSIIFPLYMRILLAMACINIAEGLLGLFLVKFPKFHHEERESTPLNVKITYCACMGISHFIFEGIAFVLLQKGCGKFAAWTAGKYAFIWSLITFGCFYCAFDGNKQVAEGPTYVWAAIIITFYLIICASPETWFYRRPASIMYARFWCFFRLFYTIFIIAEDHGDNTGWNDLSEIGSCGELMLGYVVYPIFLPLVVYWTFLQDSRCVISSDH